MKTDIVGSHSCHICQQDFSSKPAVMRHFLSIHKGKNTKFECENCDAKFDVKSHLRGHINYAHQGKKEFQCKICTNSFILQQDLDSHISAFHNNLKITLQRPKKSVIENKETKRIINENSVEYSLPYGWKKIGKRRICGAPNRWDFEVISPNGKRFRSSIEVQKYLKSNPNIKCDLEVTNTNRPKEFLARETLTNVDKKNEESDNEIEIISVHEGSKSTEKCEILIHNVDAQAKVKFSNPKKISCYFGSALTAIMHATKIVKRPIPISKSNF